MTGSASVASHGLGFSFSPSLPSRFSSSPDPFSYLPFPKSAPPSILGGFSLRRPVFERNPVLRQKSMIEFVRTAAHRTMDGDEGTGFVEREAVLNNMSSEFYPDIVSGGLESTLNRLSKWLVTAIFGAVILFRHDAIALWAAMGSIVNAVLSVTLKQILNQKRPISTSKSDPGMPSSHAQSIFFAVIFVIQSLVDWLGVNELSVIFGTLVLACGSYLSWIRVSQQYHTINQVLVGVAVGSICSILWFWSWDAIVMKAFLSLLWVRVVVVLGGSGCCLAFFVYMVRYWLTEEQ